MRNNKILTIVLILLLVVTSGMIIRYMGKKDGLLVSPGMGKVPGQAATPAPTSAYNPPKEIKFDSGTDLRRELETINPQVLDSDFEE